MWTPIEQPNESAFFPTPLVVPRLSQLGASPKPAGSRLVTDPLARTTQGEIVSVAGSESGIELPRKPGPSVRVKDDVRRFGRYHILGVLGEGGMGEVRLAYDPMLERKVALKTLRPQWQATAEHRNTRLANIERRLKREARSLAHLEHANIVEVLDVGVREGLLYVAMEYVGRADPARVGAGQ